MKKICVIGKFSGRNAGDAAILETLMKDIYSINKDVEFWVPTLNKNFIEENYKAYPVKPFPLMPWNLSVKIFGLPTFEAVLKSDLVLVTDAILFDKSLWNPLFNYLSTMALVLPMARKKGIPVVLYNSSIGPITTSLGRRCLKRVIDSCDLIMVRDERSIEFLEEENIKGESVFLHADCALNTPMPSQEHMTEIRTVESLLDGRDNYIGFNINSYIDEYMKGDGAGIGTNRFVKMIAEVMDRIIDDLKVNILFIVTQHMDIRICTEILSNVRNRDSVKMLTNKKYSHNELAGILSGVGLHIGMRTHSLILASSTCTPVISINYRPKNIGFMKSIKQEERAVNFGPGFNAENLFAIIRETWEKRDYIREGLIPVIEEEKKKAALSAQLLEPFLGL